jgi:hypothetical protein
MQDKLFHLMEEIMTRKIRAQLLLGAFYSLIAVCFDLVQCRITADTRSV